MAKWKQKIGQTIIYEALHGTLMINGMNKNLPWVYNNLYLMYYTCMGQVNIKQEVIKKNV